MIKKQYARLSLNGIILLAWLGHGALNAYNFINLYRHLMNRNLDPSIPRSTPGAYCKDSCESFIDNYENYYDQTQALVIGAGSAFSSSLSIMGLGMVANNNYHNSDSCGGGCTAFSLRFIATTIVTLLLNAFFIGLAALIEIFNDNQSTLVACAFDCKKSLPDNPPLHFTTTNAPWVWLQIGASFLILPLLIQLLVLVTGKSFIDERRESNFTPPELEAGSCKSCLVVTDLIISGCFSGCNDPYGRRQSEAETNTGDEDLRSMRQ